MLGEYYLVRAGADDHPDVLRLYQVLLNNDHRFTKEYYQEALDRSSVVLVREASGGAVGLAAWTIWPPSLSFPRRVCFIQDMVVLPSHRRNGIGQALVDYIRSLAVAEGIEVLHLQTDKPENVAFYESCGFAVCNRGLYQFLKRSVD